MPRLGGPNMRFARTWVGRYGGGRCEGRGSCRLVVDLSWTPSLDKPIVLFAVYHKAIVNSSRYRRGLQADRYTRPGGILRRKTCYIRSCHNTFSSTPSLSGSRSISMAERITRPEFELARRPMSAPPPLTPNPYQVLFSEQARLRRFRPGVRFYAKYRDIQNFDKRL